MLWANGGRCIWETALGYVCVIQNAGGLPGQILRFDQNHDAMSGRDITEF